MGNLFESWMLNAAEGLRHEVSGEALPLRIDAMRQARPHMPFDADAGRGQLLARAVQGIDGDQIVGLAVDEEDRRAGGNLGEMLGPGQQARVADDGGGAALRRSPTCRASMVPWLKPATTRRSPMRR